VSTTLTGIAVAAAGEVAGDEEGGGCLARKTVAVRCLFLCLLDGDNFVKEGKLQKCPCKV